jgi:hypothetical protein
MERRAFVTSGLAAVGTALLSGSAALAAPKTRTVFLLDPGTCGTCACSACKKHAANKLWGDVSKIRRAHKGCNCGVVQKQLHEGTYNALFGRNAEADRRRNRDAAVLRNHEPV